LILVGAAQAQVRPIPTEELADAYKRGAVGLVSPQRAGGELTFAAAEGPGFPPETLLTSPTTRTRGLIAAIDLTPDGLPARAEPGTVAELLSLKWRIEASEASRDPLLGFFGALAGVGLLFGIAATYRPKLSFPASGLLALGAAGTVALLLLARLPLLAPSWQAGAFVGGSLFLALLFRSVKRLLYLLVVVLAMDTVFHLGLVAGSALSGYYITGIRFYGIGNEYMGLLIGAALMSIPEKGLRFVGPGVVLLLGLSPLGANAGGAMAATVALTPWPPLPSRSASFRERGKCLLGRVGVAVFVAALLALVERFVLPEAMRSHIGRAAGGSFGHWGEIIQRKIGMNLRLATVPWTVLALVGVGGAALWLARSPVGRHMKEVPELSRRVEAGLFGAGAALLFNDSGVIAALLLLAPVLFAVVESALCATSASTSEQSGSGLP
jgi:hypothetical protein